MTYTTLSCPEADQKNSQNHVVRQIVPTVLIDEMDAAGLHGVARDIIYWIVYRHVTRGVSTGLHQGLLDFSVGDDTRKVVIKFIKASKYLKAALSGLYRPGASCRRYQVTDHIANLLDQHNYERCVDTGDGDVEGVSWRTVDYQNLLTRIEAGFKKLGWDMARMNAEWSLNQADAPTMTDEEIIEHFTPITEDGEFGTIAPEVQQQADAHQAAYERYRDHKTDRVLRRDGRTYTSVTSLPRWIREREVVFQGSAELLDVSACYWWILAPHLRLSRIRHGLDTVEIDGLMDLIESGDFYKKMAEMNDMPYETAEEKSNVKKAIQQHCLFSRRLGKHPLCDALKSICPQICRTIQWWHSHRNGRSELAYFLMRAEGQLMTDGLIKWLVSGGLPAIQIHDGAIVPQGVAKVAAEWLSQHSRKIYGRSCRISIVADGMKSYV